MAKTQKFTEDQLLDAVVKFADIERGKIKATELAKWCKTNVPGLEEVEYYHFTRPMTEVDTKTGKKSSKTKLCTLKIEEINNARSVTAGVNTNILLRASNIDTFFQQSVSTQKNIVVETRRLFDEVMKKNMALSRENDALRAENMTIMTDLSSLTEKITALEKAQGKLLKQVAYLMKVTDENQRKEMLEKMGIGDASIDLNLYADSLRQELGDVMNINEVLGEHLKERDKVEDTNLADEVLSGIDF